MSAPIYRTKGDLRGSLLTKLGYGGLGAAAGNFVPMADELLEEAQANLFLLMPDEKRIRTWDMVTGLNQVWYDFPADCDPDRIIELSAYFSQTWLPIKRGIDRYHDSTFNYINYYPQRYDFRSRDIEATELQSNGDFAVGDTSATGGTAGWEWTASNWEIASGRAEHITSATASITSTTPLDVGSTYDITYTIGGADMYSVFFGGTNDATNGDVLPLIIGTHTATVKAVSSTGFRIVAATNGATLSGVSVVKSGEERLAQLELWPADDTNTYTFRIEGYIQLMPFVADGDRATIDDMLILLYAEAYGKAHLNKPDAQAKMNTLKERLRILRGQQHGEQRYIRGDKTPDPLPRPIVIP